MPFKRAALDAYTTVFGWRLYGLVTNIDTASPVASQPPSESTTVVTARMTRSSFTRLAAAWWALVIGLLILIILLIFIAQNTESITVHFLLFDWSLPVGVGYLLSAVAGATTTAM